MVKVDRIRLFSSFAEKLWVRVFENGKWKMENGTRGEMRGKKETRTSFSRDLRVVALTGTIAVDVAFMRVELIFNLRGGSSSFGNDWGPRRRAGGAGKCKAVVLGVLYL